MFAVYLKAKNKINIFFFMRNKADMIVHTDYGHPERAFFQKLETFGLGQTNWAGILWGIWGISGQTISTILVQWLPCPWKRVAGSLSYKKLWFLGLKHTTPKSSQNKILAAKNLWNSVRTSVFGALHHRFLKLYKCFFSSKNFGADKEQPTVTLTIRF